MKDGLLWIACTLKMLYLIGPNGLVNRGLQISKKWGSAVFGALGA